MSALESIIAYQEQLRSSGAARDYIFKILKANGLSLKDVLKG